MVHDFENWLILESKGFPKSLVGIYDFLFDFISKKIDWWVSRKGPANYSEEFVFWEDDFNFYKDPDFPIKRFQLDLDIVVLNEKTKKPVSGRSIFYKGDIPFDNNNIGKLSIIERGEVIPSLHISIQMDKSNYMNEIIPMKNNLKSLIKHELIHLYQLFKVKIISGRNKSVWRNSSISFDISSMEEYGSKTFNDLLEIAYYLMTREEFDASLAEVTVGENGRVKSNRRRIKKFSKMNSDTLIQSIRSEVDCSDSDLEEIPKIFLEQYEKDCKKHKVQPLKWALKLRNKPFDEFISLILDIVKFRGEKWIKKANKIMYSVSK